MGSEMCIRDRNHAASINSTPLIASKAGVAFGLSEKQSNRLAAQNRGTPSASGRISIMRPVVENTRQMIKAMRVKIAVFHRFAEKARNVKIIPLNRNNMGIRAKSLDIDAMSLRLSGLKRDIKKA